MTWAPLRHWFLSARPDVMDTLRQEADLTAASLQRLLAWSSAEETPALNDGLAEDITRLHLLHRDLMAALEASFSTPLDPEDIYELAERLEVVAVSVRNTTREAELLGTGPDEAMVEMADLLSLSFGHVVAAFDALTDDAQVAREESAAAIEDSSRLEHVYRRAMSSLLAETDVRLIMARRELYRRYVRIGERVDRVARRVSYSLIKQR